MWNATEHLSVRGACVKFVGWGSTSTLPPERALMVLASSCPMIVIIMFTVLAYKIADCKYCCVTFDSFHSTYKFQIQILNYNIAVTSFNNRILIYFSVSDFCYYTIFVFFIYFLWYFRTRVLSWNQRNMDGMQVNARCIFGLIASVLEMLISKIIIV